MAKKRKADILGGVRFVKLTTLHDLPIAERLKSVLKQNGVGAVIINDEKYQARPDKERAKAVPPGEGFRLEVPDLLIEKAREILSAFEKREDEEDA